MGIVGVEFASQRWFFPKSHVYVSCLLLSCAFNAVCVCTPTNRSRVYVQSEMVDGSIAKNYQRLSVG